MSASFDPAKLNEIKSLAASGQMIHAIKIYREVTGAGLAESKAAVEAIARGEAVNIPAPVAASTPASLEGQIRQLMANGKKLEAVKVYRQATNVDLATAVDAVEAITRGQNVPAPWMGGITPSSASDSEFDARIRQLVAAGQKIEAIKLYRERTNVGLKEAKDAVEAIAQGTSDGTPVPIPPMSTANIDPFAEQTDWNGRIAAVLVALLIIIGVAAAFIFMRGGF